MTNSICVLTCGDFAGLARRCIGSILAHCEGEDFELIVGANAPGRETRKYLQELQRNGRTRHVLASEVNLYKCPMMKRMLQAASGEFIWWFDDDSHIVERCALAKRVEIARAAPQEVVQWGSMAWFDSEVFSDGSAVEFVRSAKWYRRLPPPAWKPGGKGEFDFEGRGLGDGRWFFATGGGWFMRRSALAGLDWPDPRLRNKGEDVFLGEAIRQRGWSIAEIGELGVKISDAPTRSAS